MHDVITILIMLLGSGVVVVIGGYRVSIGVQHALEPVIDQVNNNTVALNSVQSNLSTLNLVAGSPPTVTHDMNIIGTRNIYDSQGNLVFDGTEPVPTFSEEQGAGCSDTEVTSEVSYLDSATSSEVADTETL